MAWLRQRKTTPLRRVVILRNNSPVRRWEGLFQRRARTPARRVSRSYSIWPHTKICAAGIGGERCAARPCRSRPAHAAQGRPCPPPRGKARYGGNGARRTLRQSRAPAGFSGRVTRWAKHAEALFVGSHALVDAVMVIQRSLRAPADVHRAVHVRFAVFKNGAKLGPVIYFLVGQHFHGRAGNDHAVEALGFDLVEGFVKRLQMRSGHMRALVGIHVQQRQLHLQGAVGQHAGDLCFGGDFRRHQIYQQDAQRADVLASWRGPGA